MRAFQPAALLLSRGSPRTRADGSLPGPDSLAPALANSGIKVPNRCSVIGFDDVTASALFVPSLTTVRQPMEAMGASAVNIIVDANSAGADNRRLPAVHRKLASGLVVRESTRPLS